MTQQPDDANGRRRVVKKVVRKAVVPPVQPLAVQTPVTQGASAPQPKVRRRRNASPKPLVASRPWLSSVPWPHVRGRATDFRYVVTDSVRDAADHVRDGIADSWYRVIDLRLPRLSPVQRAAVGSGMLGLLALAYGWGFYQLFSTRATQAGGSWGLLAFVVLAVIAYALSELLLVGFGVPPGRPASFLAMLLVVLLVLLASGVTAWALVPTLIAISFAAWIVARKSDATQREDIRRLP